MKRLEIMFGRSFLALKMRIAEQVAKLVRIAHVAAEQRLDRVALKARLVAVLEQLEEPVVGTGRGFCAQAASAAMEEQAISRAAVFMVPPGTFLANARRGAAARPQRPFDQCAIPIYQKKLRTASTTSPV